MTTQPEPDQPAYTAEFCESDEKKEKETNLRLPSTNEYKATKFYDFEKIFAVDNVCSLRSASFSDIWIVDRLPDNNVSRLQTFCFNQLRRLPVRDARFRLASTFNNHSVKLPKIDNERHFKKTLQID